MKILSKVIMIQKGIIFQQILIDMFQNKLYNIIKVIPQVLKKKIELYPINYLEIPNNLIT